MNQIQIRLSAAELSRKDLQSALLLMALEVSLHSLLKLEKQNFYFAHYKPLKSQKCS